MIEIGFADLTIEEIDNVVFENIKLKLNRETVDRVHASFDFLRQFAKDKTIYGINTGFGPMAQYRIGESEQIEMQYNLIRSHASGAGAHLDPIYVRASMIARLNTLSLGYSGIHISAIDVLLELINHNITPLIYEHGGVGASGDLVQLAHLGLVMIGEGNVLCQGEIKPTTDVFIALGISPMKISLREGLAIMNGTSVMTGIGIINAIYAKRAVAWAVIATILICEIIESYDDYFSAELNESKKHKGQQKIARTIKKQLDGSKYVQKREQRLYESNIEQEVINNKVQEYYSIRCVPQVVGVIFETVDECHQLLEEEMNSANDNPIVHVESQKVLHGGNFHGDYVAFEMDKLKIAITKLSMLCERQLNFLMNPNLNNLLPPFINAGKLGFNFGMQGVQFTATSTTAENQMLSNPMYVHSIPNNNDNQDIVSMGTNAALAARRVIENTFEVQAIEMVSIVQAIDILGKSEGLSPAGKSAYAAIRSIVPHFTGDYSMADDLRLVKSHLMSHTPILVE